MHINSINIKNFKSYLDENVLDLNPGINIFVGKNGHGKSNFFQAISFVLSDRYPFVKPEDKIPILYSDLRDEISNELYVQLNFDNKKRRIPIEEDEVSLKRTWTHDNKDEYKLNTKVLIKNEINNIMESCGLSRSNPYNIVHQGKINKMTNMSEEDIYELLQEITGIKQYHQKKEESLKYLNETAKEKEKIKEILEEIKLKIEDLQNEKDSYENYEKKENLAKCLEFCIYQCHINELQEKLEKVNQEIKQKTEELDNKRGEKINAENEKNLIKQNISNLTSNYKSIAERKQQIALEISEFKAKQRFLEKDMSENQVKKPYDKSFLTQTKKKLDANNKEINNLQQKRLSLINEQKTLEIQIVENQATFLLTKTKFKTQNEKKEFLENEIAHLNETFEDNLKSKKELELSIDKLESKISEARNLLEKNEKGLTNQELEMKSVQKGILDKRVEKLQLASDFRSNLEKINEISFEIDENHKILKNLKENLDRKFKDNFINTINKIKEIIFERDIKGYFGVFIDMITFDPKLRLGIESIAKNKLYSLIVDDYETAKEIIQINKEIKGGMLNIYPLSWVKELKSKERKYPNSQDTIIIREKISIAKDFSDKSTELQALIEHIFGKGLFTKNYDLAVKYSKELHLNCVTPKGEMVYAEGYLTKLGFCDVNADKMSLYLGYRAKEKENEEKIVVLNAEKQGTNDFHSREITILRDLQEFQIKESQMKKHIEETKSKIDDIKGQIKNLEENIENSQKMINQLENENEKVQQKMKLLEKEKTVKISDSNNSEYQLQNDELLKIQTQYNEIKEQIILTEEKHKEMIRIKEEIQKELQEPPKENTENNTQNIEKKSLDDFVRELESSLKNVEKKEGEYEEKIGELEKQEKEIEKEMKKVIETMQEIEKSIMQQKQLKNNYIVQKDDYFQKKGNLEVIQAEMISQYSQMDLDEILKEVENLRALDKKKYTAKDRIMFEKLKDLQEKYQYFDGKLQEMSENEQVTRELIDKLDSKSESTVNEVFSVFKEHFVENFKQLVLGGDAQVKLIKIQKQEKGKIVQATGIDIKVHFVKEEDQKENHQAETGFQKMNKLSTGQKTVIALALIFALQCCDPAPFYVFDEIDAALDANYRKNIAKIIKENSQNAQYLISTFKPELTYIQDSNIYEVKFANKASHIDKITAQKAREVLKSNEVVFEEKE